MYYPGGLLSWRVDGVLGERVDGVTGDSSRRAAPKEPEKPVIKLDQLRDVPLRRLHELHRILSNRGIVGGAGLDLHHDAHQFISLEAVFRQRRRHELLDLREQLDHLLHLFGRDGRNQI